MLAGEGSAYAQNKTSAARKFDEFGDILLTDIKARLDGLPFSYRTSRRRAGS
jgi:hypothetical protein